MFGGIGCTKNGMDKRVITDHDYTCKDWLPEGTKGTITGFSEGDGTAWSENEYLKDDESNL